ncbi:hypothetical protein [Clostridium oceanicum]|uniref:Uncharacterized protein n=1 Tax=Clostridium oceanicum TaxID=1543 RepID=A0ABP3UGU2_9CLOT
MSKNQSNSNGDYQIIKKGYGVKLDSNNQNIKPPKGGTGESSPKNNNK